MSEHAGRIVLAATPIGNVGDASRRLAELLASADVVAAEDTRRIRRLAGDLGVTIGGRIVSLYEHNEEQRSEGLLEEVRAGAEVLVVSDAGMPTVSDPGYRLVAAAVTAGLSVTAAPGPSAVLTALALSGLPTDRFCFEGFLPRKSGERRSAFAALADERRTMVFFESPHRIGGALADAVLAFGLDRRAVVARELTKTYEEVVRAPLGELAEAFADGTRGEVVLVVAGGERRRMSIGDVLPEVLAAVSGGTRLKDATRDAAARHSLSSRDLYDAALAARSRTSGRG